MTGQTTITVSETTKEYLKGKKPEGKTWDEFLVDSVASDGGELTAEDVEQLLDRYTDRFADEAAERTETRFRDVVEDMRR